MADPTYREAIAIMKAEQRRASELALRADNAEREVRFLTADLASMKARAELAEARLASIGLPAPRRVMGGAYGQR